MESERFFALAEARKIDAAVFAAQANRSQGYLQTHKEGRLERFARPSVQIHPKAVRASRVPPVGPRKTARDEAVLAIKAAQWRLKADASECFRKAAGAGRTEISAAAPGTLDRHSSQAALKRQRASFCALRCHFRGKPGRRSIAARELCLRP